MNSVRIRNEHVIFAGIVMSAALLRLLYLGNQPLTDAEASLALQAARQGAPSGNPAYLMITRLLFDGFGQTNFLARFWPAISGIALVFTPLPFRRWLGPRVTLLVAAGLAMDPGLAALSRQAGSPIPAVASLLLATGFWLNGIPVAAGVFLGITLLSGPAFWPGILGAAIALLINRGSGFENRARSISPSGPTTLPTQDIPGSDDHEPAPDFAISPEEDIRRRAWIQCGIAAGAAFLVVGTGLLTQPWGIGAAASSLPGYLSTWFSAGGMFLIPLLMALVLYESLPLLFGVLGAGRGIIRRIPQETFLVWWFIVAIGLALANPGRQPSDLAWAIIPLWVLAGREIDRHLMLSREERAPSLVQFGVGLLVVLFITITFTGLLEGYQFTAPDPLTENRQNLQWLVLAGAAFLLMLISYLIAWGWAAPATMRGLVWALALVLVGITISSATRSTGISQQNGPEIWQGDAQTGQLSLLVKTIDDLSRWNTGLPGSIDVTVVNLDTPSLRWAIRNYPQVRYATALEPGKTPAVILTTADEQPGLASGYRGQDFSLSMQNTWPGSVMEWLEWAVFRRVSQVPNQMILWARNDLFADGKSNLTNIVNP